MVVFPSLESQQSLRRGHHLISPNQQFILTHQFDGNVVLYQKGKQTGIWSTGTYGKDTTSLTLERDGNLVLWSGSKPVWASVTDNRGGKVVRVEENGNIVMYNDEGKVIWESGSNVGVINNDGLLLREMTIPGHSLVSINKQNKLSFTSDGNLVVEKSGKEVWSSHSGGKGGKYLVFQNDGNLVIYGDSWSAIWSTSTGGIGAVHAVMQNDGNFVLYNKNNQSVWATATS